MKMLTREQVLEMEADRPLDRLVGGLIMELDLVDNTLPYLPKYYLPEYERTIFTDVPKYSTDISESWKVVEHLRKEHGLRLCLELKNFTGCYIWLENDMGGNVTGRYEFESEIEGICKIALLATVEE